MIYNRLADKRASEEVERRRKQLDDWAYDVLKCGNVTMFMQLPTYMCGKNTCVCVCV